MSITRIEDVEPDTPDTPVTLETSGNILEVRFTRSPAVCPIRKVTKDWGVDVRTGEAVEFKHTTTRADNLASVAQSLRNVRDLVNANTENPDTVLWVTLTYSDNMQDPEQLYGDYKKFWKRFCYHLDKNGLPHAEYITVAEPQGRGAWHLHCLFLFAPSKHPFIPNPVMARLWGHGYTTTQSLDKIKNPGLYLSCYLGDMSLENSVISGTFNAGRLVEVESKDGQGKAVKKSVVKKARLALYPPALRLCRCSRGVKRPAVYKTTEGEAQAVIGDAPLTYEKTVAITGEDGAVQNIINYRQYNKKKGELSNETNLLPGN